MNIVHHEAVVTIPAEVRAMLDLARVRRTAEELLADDVSIGLAPTVVADSAPLAADLDAHPALEDRPPTLERDRGIWPPCRRRQCCRCHRRNRWHLLFQTYHDWICKGILFFHFPLTCIA